MHGQQMQNWTDGSPLLFFGIHSLKDRTNVLMTTIKDNFPIFVIDGGAILKSCCMIGTPKTLCICNCIWLLVDL